MNTCKCCGIEYTNGATNSYCSESCRYIKILAAKGFKYKLTCAVCGNLFLTNKRRDSKYCSKTCEAASPARVNTIQIFREKRRKWLDSIKLLKGCEQCGYNKHPAALHFDHIDPSLKSFNISQDVKRAKNKILEEIAKCRILCANCHSIHTFEENHYNLRKDIGNDANN